MYVTTTTTIIIIIIIIEYESHTDKAENSQCLTHRKGIWATPVF
jgi:hypothetical protein